MLLIDYKFEFFGAQNLNQLLVLYDVRLVLELADLERFQHVDLRKQRL